MQKTENQFSDASEIREIKGALHLHTTYSDGGVDFPILMSAAREVGLDYVVVTDHMTLNGKNAGYEGHQNGLFVLVGYEHHDSNKKNHYLAVGVNEIPKTMEPQEYINAVKENGGIGFLAHPAERRHYFRQYPPYPWTDWDVNGYDGIELWNQMSEWVENLKNWSSFARVMYPRRFLRAIPPDLAQKWDNYNRERFVSGIAGVDAHTVKVKIGFFTIRVFPIKVELKGLRTHLYLSKDLSDLSHSVVKETLITSLRDGRGFISNYRRGDATGSRIFYRSPSGHLKMPGRRDGGLFKGGSIEVSIPYSGKILLNCNSQVIAEKFGTSASFPIKENGAYRIEVHRKGKAWIYSNHFPVGNYPL